MSGFQSKFSSRFFAGLFVTQFQARILQFDQQIHLLPAASWKMKGFKERACRKPFEVSNIKERQIDEEQLWKAKVCVDKGLSLMFTEILHKIHLEGLIMTEVSITPFPLPTWFSFLPIHMTRFQMVMAVSNARLSHVAWTLIFGTYSVNNRWYPASDTEPGHFCLDHSKWQLLHNTESRILWWMSLLPSRGIKLPTIVRLDHCQPYPRRQA